MADPGKTSKRRPGDLEAFSSNYDRIFGKSERTPGRHYYRWNGEKFEEINPPKPISSDLMFEGTFQSPVDGSVIQNKHDLDYHNKKNNVVQAVPGFHDDVVAAQKDSHDKAFGKQSKEDRLEDVKRALHTLGEK